MIMKKKIAITGGIGSGKSTVLREISKMGYPVFSCDEIYKKVIITPTYMEEIGCHFPNCIKDGKVDRQALSTAIFQNENSRKKLNELSHPLIMSNLLTQMDASPSRVVFAEVPLLFEGNFESLFDGVIVVSRKIEERIQSLIVRDNITKEEINARISAQFDYHSETAVQRLKNCNAYIVENEGDISNLQTKISQFIQSL